MADEAQTPEGPVDGMVECVKLGRRAEALPKPPLKGEMGKKIYAEVSKEAWKMWLEHSKMFINEFRIDLMTESGQRVWFSELEKYFWGEGSALPPEFTAEKKAEPAS